MTVRCVKTEIPVYYVVGWEAKRPKGRPRILDKGAAKPTALREVGDVTVVLSKRRRNDGPQQTKVLPEHTVRGIVRFAVENGIQYNKNHGQRVPVASKMDLNWGKA
jgi:hypothetical protein